MGLFSFIANADNRRSIKRLQTIVDKVNAQESKFAAMSDAELRGMRTVFSDNSFTLLPGVPRTITFSLPETIGEEAVRKALVIRDLRSSYRE